MSHDPSSVGRPSRAFHTITLGCKLNQFDTAALEGELTRRGFRPAADSARAQVVVLNTCTVTGNADREARKRIRRVRRGNPHCRLLVTGCLAERDREGLEATAGVDLVFGNREKRDFATILDRLGIAAGHGDDRPATEAPVPELAGPADDRGCDGALRLPDAVHFGERSRAFLKIQEGCRLVCSYCVIPSVRGPSRSVPPEQVEAALVSLERAGYPEVVLTGVNTGDYGRDLATPLSLATLLERLLRATAHVRLRLNSLEPRTVTDEIVGLLACEPRLAPHLQVPLQSASDAVLRGMRRNYGVETYFERLDRLRDRVPEIGLGADVIVGFPGETPEHFHATRARIASSELNYLHVFSWSPRPGTPAAELDGRVSGAETRHRSAELRALGATLAEGFRSRFVDRELDAVALGPRSSDRRVRALTGNYIEVLLPPDAATPGAPVRVQITEVTPRETLAVARGRPAWAGPARVS